MTRFTSHARADPAKSLLGHLDGEETLAAEIEVEATAFADRVLRTHEINMVVAEPRRPELTAGLLVRDARKNDVAVEANVLPREPGDERDRHRRMVLHVDGPAAPKAALRDHARERWVAPLRRIRFNDVEVRGEVADLDVRVLELGALKGLIQGLVHDPVSYVNAPVLAQQRGVEVALTTDKDSDDHRNLVRVRLTLSDGAWVSVAGTVSGAKDVAKLVEVDSFDVDVPISEHMVFFRYHDRPGVVGTVGRILGEADVNIGGMQVSRDESGEHSVIVLTVDQAVPADVLERIVSEIGAHTGRAVDLAF